MKLLKLLRCHLSQLEVFEVNEIDQADMYISEVIEGLNPNILSSLKIYSDNGLLDGLVLIKTKFSNLRMLQLKPTSPFIIMVHGKFDTDIIKCLGALKQLKSTKLIGHFDFSYFINSIDSAHSYNNIKLIEDDDIISMRYFGVNNLIGHDYLKLSTLKEIHVAKLSRELLKAVSVLSNIQTIHFHNFIFIPIPTFVGYIYNNEDLCKIKYT